MDVRLQDAREHFSHPLTHSHTYIHMCTHSYQSEVTSPLLPFPPGEEHKEAVSQHCKLVMDTQGKMKEAFQVQ